MDVAEWFRVTHHYVTYELGKDSAAAIAVNDGALDGGPPMSHVDFKK